MKLTSETAEKMIGAAESRDAEMRAAFAPSASPRH